MNKKFSTLLAGVALLGAMSANAGNPVTSLQKTGNGLYQLKAAGGVLAMTPEGALKLKPHTAPPKRCHRTDFRRSRRPPPAHRYHEGGP